MLALLEEARVCASNLGEPDDRILEACLRSAMRETVRQIDELLRASVRDAGNGKGYRA